MTVAYGSQYCLLRPCDFSITFPASTRIFIVREMVDLTSPRASATSCWLAIGCSLRYSMIALERSPWLFASANTASTDSRTTESSASTSFMWTGLGGGPSLRFIDFTVISVCGSDDSVR